MALKAKISVIIPVYNTKDYLEESIDSVIEQKEFFHELILIDDGSTDGSGQLLDKLYSRFDFIKIYHTENQRQGPARNLGTDHSSGDYIYYFDSDDVVKPGLFEKFNDIITDDTDLDIFCFSADPFIDNNYHVEDSVREQILSSKAYFRKIDKICKSGEEAFNLLFPIKSFSPLPYLYIFKKSIITENNIKYRSIRFEDEEFVFQLFLNAGKTIISDERFVGRRIREGSTMELDRCFADIMGYISTIETIKKLQETKSLEERTKNNLDKKIIELAKAMIVIKVRSNFSFTDEEKKIYNTCIKPILRSNSELRKFSLLYPIEIKLRTLKQRFFR